MFARVDEARELETELRLWEQANHRRHVVLTDIIGRLGRQVERDERVLRELATLRSRLDKIDESGSWRTSRPCLAVEPRLSDLLQDLSASEAS